MADTNPEITHHSAPEKEKFLNLCWYKNAKGPFGIEIDWSELLKIETSDAVLDHIFSHLSKEIKNVMKDPM